MVIQFSLKDVSELVDLLKEDDKLIATKEQVLNPSYHIDEDLSKPINQNKLITSFIFHKNDEVYLTLNTNQKKRVYAEGFKNSNENQHIKIDMLNEALQLNDDITQTKKS